MKNRQALGCSLIGLGLAWFVLGFGASLFAEPANFLVRTGCCLIWAAPTMVGIVGGYIIHGKS